MTKWSCPLGIRGSPMWATLFALLANVANLDPIEDAGPTSPAPVGDAVSPEEDTFLMQPASQPRDPAAGSHSPRSKAGTVLGEMAELSLTSPSQPELAEDEIPPWVSTSAGSRSPRTRLHHESLPLQVEVLDLSPPSPHPGRVWRKKLDGRWLGQTCQKRGMWQPQFVILVI